MTKPVLGTFTALLLAFLGGWVWSAHGSSAFDRGLPSSELRNDLMEAQTSLLAARVDLYERSFRSASRRLEDARALLRRAAQRGKYLGWRDEENRLDLDRFEAEIDEAQRLLRQLGQGVDSVAPRRQGVVDRCPRIRAASAGLTAVS